MLADAAGSQAGWQGEWQATPGSEPCSLTTRAGQAAAEPWTKTESRNPSWRIKAIAVASESDGAHVTWPPKKLEAGWVELCSVEAATLLGKCWHATDCRVSGKTGRGRGNRSTWG